MFINSFFDELDQLISMLKIFSDSGIPIVVEGLKDERSLRTLGVSGQIIRLSGKNLLKVAEELAQFENFLILTDFDREGRVLALRLSRYLDCRKVDLTRSFRRRFQNLVSKITCDIEGLASSYLNLQNQSWKNVSIDW
ncbi:MAG: toprim domain-containing protein [Candidatus Freyarchaeum deiterrae]